METLMRGDGCPMSNDLEDIEKRVARAEYAAMHIVNNASLWQRYYEDTPQDNRLISDFLGLVRENKMLRSRLSEALYKIESLEG